MNTRQISFRVFLLSLLLLLLGYTSVGFAGPGSGMLIPFSQPDGSMFNARIMGDEFLNWAETVDGYTIVKNPDTQYWEYAVKDASGRLAGSGIMVSQVHAALPDFIVRGVRPEPQISRVQWYPEGASEYAWVPTPVSGNRNVLIILISFADKVAITATSDWNTSVFSTSAKAVARFYKENSFNTFGIVPAAHTQSGIAGVISVMLVINHPNYGGSSSWSADQTVGNAALAQASAFMDFNSYDTNGDGILQTSELCIYFIYAGYEASGSSKTPSVWAHAWTTTGTGLTAGSKNIQRWALNGELNDAGVQHPMGVIAHEMGHQLCALPDLYDTTGHNAGLGNFSLMAGGSWGFDVGEYQGTTPVSMDAWCREYLGWTWPSTTATGSVSLYPALTDNTSAVKLVNSSISTTEYWLVENRYPISWDLGLRGFSGFGAGWQGGLFIEHVDNAIGSEAYGVGAHQGVLVEQASTAACSMVTTTCRGDKTTLFYSGNNSSWGPSTTPDSNYYSGTASNFSVSSISGGGSPMTMIFSGSGGLLAPTLISPAGTITTSTPTYTWAALPTATWYYLWVNDSTGNKINAWYTSAQVNCPSGTGNCSVTPSTALALGGGTWWVQGYDGTYGPWSAPLSFTYALPTVPAAATQVSPTGTIYTSSPTYTWNAVSNATWYYLWVDDSTGHKIDTWYSASSAGCGSGTGTCSVIPAVTIASGSRTDSVTPAIEFSPGSATWWVQTWNSVGYGPWSTGMSFYVSPLPGKPTTISPSGMTYTTTPAYTWNALPNATWYYLWVDDSSGHKINTWYTASQAGCASGTGTCSITPATTLAYGAAMWWVLGWNSNGSGPWSDGNSFTVAQNTKPTLISPNGTITTTTPAYTWNAVSTATWYYLWVNDSAGHKIDTWYTASAVGCASGTGTCSITPAVALATGNATWWVQAYGPFGYGPWSDGMAFNVTISAGGFNSQFNGDATNWYHQLSTPLWYVDSNYLYTFGAAGVFASVYYGSTGDITTLYGDFDYQAALWRAGAGCQTCSTGIMLRGFPTPFGTGNRWDNGYGFFYSADGMFAIFEYTAGSAASLVSWTSHSAVKTGGAWNVLRAVASGTTITFYINSVQVAQVVNAKYTSGKVGIIMYGDGTASDEVWADWAILTTLTGPSLTETGAGIIIDDSMVYPEDLSDGGRGFLNGFQVRPFRLSGLPEESEVKVIIKK